MAVVFRYKSSKSVQVFPSSLGSSSVLDHTLAAYPQQPHARAQQQWRRAPASKMLARSTLLTAVLSRTASKAEHDAGSALASIIHLASGSVHTHSLTIKRLTFELCIGASTTEERARSTLEINSANCCALPHSNNEGAFWRESSARASRQTLNPQPQTLNPESQP